MPRFAPAGNHIVSARFDSTVNYYAASREVELVIKQKSVTVSFSGYTGLVYNGLDRSLTDEIQVTFNGVVEGDVCEPVKTFSPETVKNAGTYFLEVRPGNPNYKTTGSISITFTIAKKTLVVSATANDVVAGTQPTFNITYEGFIENDDESDLTVAPTVGVLVDAMGRVNYGEHLYDRKGISAVMFNNQFLMDFTVTSFPLDNIDKIDWALDAAGYPKFFRGFFRPSSKGECFVRFDGFTKGYIWVNGFNLGRFWNKGPQKALYLPGAILDPERENEIVLLELEHAGSDSVQITDKPDLG